ncbi:MAG: ABC transporter permease [Candidatus Methylomirabilia bacterium]
MDFLSVVFVVGLLAATLRMATPLLFATLGELLTERAGVLNLGIEGTMLMGAMAGYLVAYRTGNLWLGLLGALLTGAALGLLMALMAVTLGVSQHVSGLGITLLATGLSQYVYRMVVGAPSVPPSIRPFEVITLPWLDHLPVIGPVLFQQYLLVWVALALVPLISLLLFRTHVGLKIRTVGENPKAAEVAGVSVYGIRYLSLTVGGMLMALGGAFLSLAHFNMFLFGMVAGRGWISIALVVFGNWRPGKCLAGALFFGGLDAFQLRLQAVGFKAIPYQFFLILPFVLTIAALVGVSRRAAYPGSLLLPYKQGEA